MDCELGVVLLLLMEMLPYNMLGWMILQRPLGYAYTLMA